MKTIKQTVGQMNPGYPLEKLGEPGKILFLDIETTGFGAGSSSLYLIGCAFHQPDGWKLVQWLAENKGEEATLLDAFWAFVKNFKILVHFNGKTFDLPFLARKSEAYGLCESFDAYESIDLYQRAVPLKSFLKLPDCRQKTIEAFLGNDRKDRYSGQELIEIYQRYSKEPSEDLEKLLLLHNAEDVKGLVSLLSMLCYYDLLDGKTTVRKAQANYYKDLDENRRQELLMSLQLATPLPKPVSASANDCYLVAGENLGSLRVPIYEGELKYFYANYKDYYYLPAEDMALHKSVAGFVDRQYRVQATASTCYTRKNSLYLPQWKLLRQPFFKQEYKSPLTYFELTDELKHDRQAFCEYANHVLEMLFFNA